MKGVFVRTIFFSAACFIYSHRLDWNDGHSVKAKFLNLPGGILSAIKAASMENVPEPHMGSKRGSAPVYPESIRAAEARVSRMGALAVRGLIPRL